MKADVWLLVTFRLEVREDIGMTALFLGGAVFCISPLPAPPLDRLLSQ